MSPNVLRQKDTAWEEGTKHKGSQLGLAEHSASAETIVSMFKLQH